MLKSLKLNPTLEILCAVGIQWCSPVDEDENPLENENAGKKGIVVNANSAEGQQVIYDLVKDADVFLTNTRQKALVRSKLDYDFKKEINPALVYGHLLGYGEKGPAKDTPAFDYTAILHVAG